MRIPVPLTGVDVEVGVNVAVGGVTGVFVGGMLLPARMIIGAPQRTRSPLALPVARMVRMKRTLLPARGQVDLRRVVLFVVLFAPLPEVADIPVGIHVIETESHIATGAVFAAHDSPEAVTGLDGESGIKALDVTVIFVLR
jgi:hypothetical protein